MDFKHTKFQLHIINIDKVQQLKGATMLVEQIKQHSPVRKKPQGAPKWFTDFVNNEFQPLVKRIDHIEQRLDRLERIVRLNNLKTE